MSQFNFETVKSSEQPMNNLHAMIDVESLGVNVGCPVVTVGATLFDPFSCDSSEELLRRSVLIRIDIQDAIDNGGVVEGGTLRWWFEQSNAAIKALVGSDAVSCKEALNKLFRYCNDRGNFVNDEFFEGLAQMPKACQFWAKDPDFDMRLLEFYYARLGIIMPWKFHENRSVRTVQDLAWPGGSTDRPEFQIPGVAHDARWDAVHQAMMVQAAIFRLGQSRDQDVKFKNWEGVK